MTAARSHDADLWRELHPRTRLTLTPAALTSVRAPQSVLRYDGPLSTSAREVAHVLRYSLGVSGWEPRGPLFEPLFCAPSSGNLRTVEAYVVSTAPGSGLTTIAHYDAVNDSLVECGHVRAAAPPGALVVLRAHAERQVSRYGPRGARYALLDLGHAVGAVCFACDAMQIASITIEGNAERTLQAMMGAIGEDGALTTAGIVVGDNALAWEQWLAHASPKARFSARSRLEATARAVVPEPAVSTLPSRPFAAIFGRRSARAFGESSVELDLACAIARADGSWAPFARLRRFVIANDDGHAGRLLELGRWENRVVRDSWERDETAFLCGYQSIASEAAAVIVLAADYWIDDVAYSDLHVAAGAASQAICLSAELNGVASRPLGGFFDEEIADALGAPHALVLATIAVGARA